MDRSVLLQPKFFGVCVILLSTLAACTPSTVTPATSLPPEAKSIVIVPSLPDKLIVDTRGVTIFGNNLDLPSITD